MFPIWQRCAGLGHIIELPNLCNVAASIDIPRLGHWVLHVLQLPEPTGGFRHHGSPSLRAGGC